MYVPFSCLGIRMHACLLETTRDSGDTRFKGNQSYAFTHTQHFTTYVRDNRRITEKLFTQQGKARKECGALIPTKIEV